MDSLVCGDCGAGEQCPVTPRPGADWVCAVCYSSRPDTEARTMLTHWSTVLERAAKAGWRELCELLVQLGRVFPPVHYYQLEVKRKLMELVEDYEEDTLERLASKVSHCQDHLAVQAVVAPGLSEYRAYLSSQLAPALYWLAKRRYIAREITGPEYRAKLEVTVALMMRLFTSMCD